MRESLQKHIEKRLGKSPSNIDVVLSSFKEKKIKKNEIVLAEGSVCNSIYFVVNGCLQINGLSELGNISILGFVFEDNWYTEMNSFQNRIGSSQTIVATETTELLTLNYDKFITLKSKVPEFASTYTEILEESYNQFMERINVLMTKNASERLIWFSDQNPKIFNRLNSKTIAQYLKITPETLTRLKPKLFNH